MIEINGNNFLVRASEITDRNPYDKFIARVIEAAQRGEIAVIRPRPISTSSSKHDQAFGAEIVFREP